MFDNISKNVNVLQYLTQIYQTFDVTEPLTRVLVTIGSGGSCYSGSGAATKVLIPLICTTKAFIMRTHLETHSGEKSNCCFCNWSQLQK